jgi:hypothetical protein
MVEFIRFSFLLLQAQLRGSCLPVRVHCPSEWYLFAARSKPDHGGIHSILISSSSSSITRILLTGTSTLSVRMVPIRCTQQVDYVYGYALFSRGSNVHSPHLLHREEICCVIVVSNHSIFSSKLVSAKLLVTEQQ